MCMSSGPSQAEQNLMNAQAQQIADQRALIKQQEAEAAEARRIRQAEINAEKAADVRKQEQERSRRARTSSTAGLMSGKSATNLVAATGSLLRRGAPTS